MAAFTIDIQRQKCVLLDICQGLELIVDVGVRIFDINGREILLSWVVLKLLHEEHP
jgi:hypothetical protein